MVKTRKVCYSTFPANHGLHSARIEFMVRGKANSGALLSGPRATRTAPTLVLLGKDVSPRGRHLEIFKLKMQLSSSWKRVLNDHLSAVNPANRKPRNPVA